MPSHAKHCEISLKLYGKTFSELHKWMDFPSIVYGINHRIFRHDPFRTPAEAMKLFGTLAYHACLDHIILDILSTNKGEKFAEDMMLENNSAIRRHVFLLSQNFNRTILTSEEISEHVGFLIGVGYSVQDITQMTGMSKRSVYRYMPLEMKDVTKCHSLHKF